MQSQVASVFKPNLLLSRSILFSGYSLLDSSYHKGTNTFIRTTPILNIATTPALAVSTAAAPADGAGEAVEGIEVVEDVDVVEEV
jgi:hypothetical protein